MFRLAASATEANVLLSSFPLSSSCALFLLPLPSSSSSAAASNAVAAASSSSSSSSFFVSPLPLPLPARRTKFPLSFFLLLPSLPRSKLTVGTHQGFTKTTVESEGKKHLFDQTGEFSSKGFFPPGLILFAFFLYTHEGVTTHPLRVDRAV